MPVNSNNTSAWKEEIATSVDYYNAWFMTFAPKAYRDQRQIASIQVQDALKSTQNLRKITPQVLLEKPALVEMLRMTTAPPIARDRLIGLAQVHPNLIDSIEIKKKLPPRMKNEDIRQDLVKVSNLILKMADKDIFTWLDRNQEPTQEEVTRASLIIADRLCGSQSNPIIRNAQEKRQFLSVKNWLEKRGYREIKTQNLSIDHMDKGTFAFRLNLMAQKSNSDNRVKIPIDIVIMPKTSSDGELPLFIEAKSCGDFTNTNKRRKEESDKMSKLKATYDKEGYNFRYILLLCGYFDTLYLGFVAGELFDWVWEHRLNDLEHFGL